MARDDIAGVLLDRSDAEVLLDPQHTRDATCETLAPHVWEAI
jgi:hypothetical protein